MEYLTWLLQQLRYKPDFNFHPKCERIQIIRLSFVDDLLLFSSGDTGSAKMLYEVFQEFSLASGLIANNDKNSIYFGAVPHDIQAEILQELGFSQGQLPFRYLGSVFIHRRWLLCNINH